MSSDSVTAAVHQTLKEVQDTLAVTAAIQARQAELLKGHSEWLASHDKAMLELRERDRILDERIETLAFAIGELILKRP